MLDEQIEVVDSPGRLHSQTAHIDARRARGQQTPLEVSRKFKAPSVVRAAVYQEQPNLVVHLGSHHMRPQNAGAGTGDKPSGWQPVLIEQPQEPLGGIERRGRVARRGRSIRGARYHGLAGNVNRDDENAVRGLSLHGWVSP
ncbi:MAG: hypothetical protein WEH44_09555 [Pirellulaceae bacterium]